MRLCFVLPFAGILFVPVAVHAQTNDGNTDQHQSDGGVQGGGTVGCSGTDCVPTGRTERAPGEEPAADRSGHDTALSSSEGPASAQEAAEPKSKEASPQTTQIDGKSDDPVQAEQVDQGGAKPGPADAVRKSQEAAGASSQALSTAERRRVREAFERGIPAESLDLDISVSIGSPLPRSVALLDVPPTVVEIAPAYRSYRFAYVRDRIYIVDPVTYVVVDIVPVSGQRANLELDDQEVRYVAEVTPRKGRRADIGIRLGLGASIPAHVDVYRFPRDMRDRIPVLADYRYVVVQNEIVIVEPDARQVVLVVSE